MILTTCCSPKLIPGRQNTSLFESHVSIYFYIIKTWKHQLRHFVKVPVWHSFIFLMIFIGFLASLFGTTRRPLFAHLIAPETLQISTWPSKVMLSSWRNDDSRKIIFFMKQIDIEKTWKMTPTLHRKWHHNLKKTIIWNAPGRPLIRKALLDLNMTPQDLHFGPPRLENPFQIHEFRTHFTSNTF